MSKTYLLRGKWPNLRLPGGVKFCNHMFFSDDQRTQSIIEGTDLFKKGVITVVNGGAPPAPAKDDAPPEVDFEFDEPSELDVVPVVPAEEPRLTATAINKMGVSELRRISIQLGINSEQSGSKLRREIPKSTAR